MRQQAWFKPSSVMDVLFSYLDLEIPCVSKCHHQLSIDRIHLLTLIVNLFYHRSHPRHNPETAVDSTLDTFNLFYVKGTNLEIMYKKYVKSCMQILYYKTNKTFLLIKTIL